MDDTRGMWQVFDFMKQYALLGLMGLGVFSVCVKHARDITIRVDHTGEGMDRVECIAILPWVILSACRTGIF
jgi:hypothetical protein